MIILEAVQKHRSKQQRTRRETAIGADLIPRAPHEDDRFAGVDLAARGRAVETLRVGMARLDLSPDELPAELRQIAERISDELKVAGSDEIGRWATDVLYAYSEIRNISPQTEAAMYLAWALAVEGPVRDRAPPASNDSRK